MYFSFGYGLVENSRFDLGNRCLTDTLIKIEDFWDMELIFTTTLGVITLVISAICDGSARGLRAGRRNPRHFICFGKQATQSLQFPNPSYGPAIKLSLLNCRLLPIPITNKDPISINENVKLGTVKYSHVHTTGGYSKSIYCPFDGIL